jgi:hypothetical protein
MQSACPPARGRGTPLVMLHGLGSMIQELRVLHAVEMAAS